MQLVHLQVMFQRAHVPIAAVAEGFLKPTVPRPAIGQAVALVGSLIMPHNIYLHSALVQVSSLLCQHGLDSVAMSSKQPSFWMATVNRNSREFG